MSDQHPAVDAAEALARDLLAPQAAAVDQGAVPRSHLSALGAAGLLGLAWPQGRYGTVPRHVVRRVHEVLAGADCSTWFVAVQHHGVVGQVAASASPRARDLLPRLASGEVLAAVAFSHLRRWPDRPVTARRAAGGWVLDGTAPWVTSWGIADVLLLSGASEDGQVVSALVPARDGAALTASDPLRLAAMTATGTVRLDVDGLAVGDDDVVSVAPVEGWLEADGHRTADVVPAVLGVAERAIDLLADLGRERRSAPAHDAARRLGGRLDEVRSRAYALIDDVPAGERVDDRLAARADAQRLAVEATQALVAAGGGRAMSLDQPGQRLAREAMFLQVQAQTAPSRDALLRRWG